MHVVVVFVVVSFDVFVVVSFGVFVVVPFAVFVSVFVFVSFVAQSVSVL